MTRCGDLLPFWRFSEAFGDNFFVQNRQNLATFLAIFRKAKILISDHLFIYLFGANQKEHYLGSGGRPARAFYFFSLVKSLKWLSKKRKVFQTWEVSFIFKKNSQKNYFKEISSRKIFVIIFRKRKKKTRQLSSRVATRVIFWIELKYFILRAVIFTYCKWLG